MGRVHVYNEGYTNADGYKLHYLEWGKQGKNIVLLHGSAPYCSAHDLEAFGNSLSEEYHIMAFDLIGHAQSDDPKSLLGFKEHAAILHKAAQLKGFTKVILVGWSFGGWLSMVWANQYPEDVERIALIDIIPVTYTKPTPQDPENTPAYFSGEKEAVEFFLNKFTTLTDKPPRRYVEESVRRSPRDADGRVYPLSHHSRRLSLRKDLDLWRYFAAIEVPMLLVWGRDSMIPSDEVGRMKAVNKYLRVVEIGGANHFVPMSHPNESIEAVKTFFTEN